MAEGGVWDLVSWMDVQTFLGWKENPGFLVLYENEEKEENEDNFYTHCNV